jgi:hypothetical protein
MIRLAYWSFAAVAIAVVIAASAADATAQQAPQADPSAMSPETVDTPVKPKKVKVKVQPAMSPEAAAQPPTTGTTATQAVKTDPAATKPAEPQKAETKTAAKPVKQASSPCKGLYEAACREEPACSWVGASKQKDGTEVKAFCRKAPSSAKAKPADSMPTQAATDATTAAKPQALAGVTPGTEVTASPCKGLPEGDCRTNTECLWIAPWTKKDGTAVQAYCRKKGGNAAKTPPPPPVQTGAVQPQMENGPPVPLATKAAVQEAKPVAEPVQSGITPAGEVSAK